jgi:hypothetical protein
MLERSGYRRSRVVVMDMGLSNRRHELRRD